MEDNGFMEIVIWLIVMIPSSMLFTGIGIYAWKRKKPMWFWSGSTVDEAEISDIPAYNRANGIVSQWAENRGIPPFYPCIVKPHTT